MELTFEVPGRPQGKGRPRACTVGRDQSRIRIYTPDKTAAYESRIRACYLAARSRMEYMREAFKAPAELSGAQRTPAKQPAETAGMSVWSRQAARTGLAAGNGQAAPRFAPPVELWIEAYFAIPKSYSKKRAALCRDGLLRPTARPDLDNIAKAVADALSGVAYRDDSAVADLTVKKRYGSPERLVVTLRGEPDAQADGSRTARASAGEAPAPKIPAGGRFDAKKTKRVDANG